MKPSKILLTLMSFTLTLSPALAQSGKVPVIPSASSSATKIKIGPLGDLAAYRTILEDTLALVQGGKTKAATTRITAFESLWDKEAATLGAKDRTKWRTLDVASDEALGAVRSSTATKAASVKALQNLLDLINAG